MHTANSSPQYTLAQSVVRIAFSTFCFRRCCCTQSQNDRPVVTEKDMLSNVPTLLRASPEGYPQHSEQGGNFDASLILDECSLVNIGRALPLHPCHRRQRALRFVRRPTSGLGQSSTTVGTARSSTTIPKHGKHLFPLCFSGRAHCYLGDRLY